MANVTVTKGTTLVTDISASTPVGTRTLAELQTTTSCVVRPCPTTAFLCASESGGGCCPLNYTCGGDGSCSFTESTPAFATTTVPPVAQMETLTSPPPISNVSSPTASEVGSASTAIPTKAPSISIVLVTASPIPNNGNRTPLIAGLSVGLPLGFACVGAAVFLMIRKRRATRKLETRSGAEFRKSELPGDMVFPEPDNKLKAPTPLFSDGNFSELPGPERPRSELQGEGIIAELPGDGRTDI